MRAMHNGLAVHHQFICTIELQNNYPVSNTTRYLVQIPRFTPDEGLEPSTSGLKVPRSTVWANRAVLPPYQQFSEYRMNSNINSILVKGLKHDFTSKDMIQTWSLSVQNKQLFLTISIVRRVTWGLFKGFKHDFTSKDMIQTWSLSVQNK